MNEPTTEPTATLALQPSDVRHAKTDWLVSSMKLSLVSSLTYDSRASMMTIAVVSSIEITVAISESV